MIFIFDWDGTLGGKSGVINKYNQEAANYLSNKGHKIYIATGRHFNGIENLVKKLPISDLIICTNGASIINRTNKNYEIIHSIKTDEIKVLIDMARKNKKIFGYGNEDDIFWRHFKGDKGIKIPNRDMSFTQFKESDWIEINKGLSIFGFFCYTKEEKNEIYNFMVNSFGKKAAITSSGDGFVQIVPESVSKWSGIKELLKLENIKNEKIISFGDGGNDISMIKNSDIGVAMGHSGKELKSNANVILEDKEDAILEYVLKNF